MNRIGLLLLLPLVVLLGVFCALSASSHRIVPSVALVDGKLRPLPATPNGVSSEAGTRPEAAVAPLRFAGSAAEAWRRAQEAVRAIGGRIEPGEGDHLWATFRSPVFRFVDDLELRLDRPEGRIEVRSGSRVGYYDLGRNRRRVEALRRTWMARESEGAPPGAAGDSRAGTDRSPP